MAESSFFERNLLALSEKNPELSSRLRETAITSRYKFLESGSGELIPALLDPLGAAHPLHSMRDPGKEAKRLINSPETDGFLILLGLGGVYYAEAALEREDISMVLVIEYDLCGLAELLRNIDYVRLFKDPRFRICAGMSEEELEHNILNLYQPVLSGGIRVIPLRSRTSFDKEYFARAAEVIHSAINRVSSDYSVQVHFGKRWLSNTVRNLKAASGFEYSLPRINRAAVTAAGPSLSMQIPLLREKRNELFLIATDTSLPCLLHEKITPDAVISIDCQHISYCHFMDGLPEEVFLFLDIASPPLLSRLGKRPCFLLGAHPLSRYISRLWRAMPELDTSGGNVCYAALSLAELLGAGEIELYGADFSYPGGISYARGAYIYSIFEKQQTRFSSLEAQASAFLYRTPLEKKRNGSNSWYYETKILGFYRERLEEKSKTMEAKILPVQGLGAPIAAKPGKKNFQNAKKLFYGKAMMEAEKFLCLYKSGIEGLPKAGRNAAAYLASLNEGERAVLATILPAAAALKQGKARESFGELLEEAKAFCIKEIDKALSGK